MTVSLCKHRFSLVAPGGSLFHPSDCIRCGITWEDSQKELQRQKHALILGTSHDGDCPDCNHRRRLFRFQAPGRPWHDFDYEPPVRFLCMSCWNAAADADEKAADDLVNSI
jgi:DNA-directed RNA polymerase subunit RPC12/RpoP